MTKSELIAALAARTAIPISQSAAIVDTVFETMTDALISGDEIELRGFGSFTVRSYQGYKGRNPRSGAAVDIAPNPGQTGPVPDCGVSLSLPPPRRARCGSKGRRASGEKRCEP